MVFAVGMLMETNSPAHRDIQQANQLACFSLATGARNEGFQIHLTGTDGHSTPALQITVPPLLRALQLTRTIK